jgi:GTP cyclohydrolase II
VKDDTGRARQLADRVEGSVKAATVRRTVIVTIQRSRDEWAEAEMVTFNELVDGREHLALIFGDALEKARPLVRVHSECLTGDVFGSARCDCGPQLREAISVISSVGGVILYLRQEGRGIGLYNKLDAYELQDRGMDTFQANRALGFPSDTRSYLVAAQMLLALGINDIEIFTNNPDKVGQLRRYGVTVGCQRTTRAHPTRQNQQYLWAKILHAGHSIDPAELSDIP